MNTTENRQQWNQALKTFFKNKGVSWVCHPQYKNYLFSTDGQVFSIHKNKVIKSTANNTGYRYIKIYENGKKVSRNPHRLLMEAISPKFLWEAEVNHMNFDKNNNGIDNLEWMSRKENLDHFYKYGNKNTLRGEKQITSKLTNKKVINIFHLKRNNLTLKQIADIHKVTIQTVWSVLKRKTWSHVNLEESND